MTNERSFGTPSTSIVVVSALTLSIAAFGVRYGIDSDLTLKKFHGVATGALGESGRERIVQTIAFSDDDVELRVPFGELELAAEDVDGQVAWFRALADAPMNEDLGEARRAAKLGVRHRHRGIVRTDGDKVIDDENNYEFTLPEFDIRLSSERSKKTALTGEMLNRVGKLEQTSAALGQQVSSEETLTPTDADGAKLVETIEAASIELSDGAVMSVKPESVVVEVSDRLAAARMVGATKDMAMTMSKTTMNTALPAPEVSVSIPEDDDLTAALSTSRVTYKKKIDTTNDVNLYVKAFQKFVDHPKSSSQMGWKPADADILTQKSIHGNEDLEKETLSIDFLTRFPVHLPKSALETQIWKPFGTTNHVSLRDKNQQNRETAQRVTEAAVEIVRAEQSQDHRPVQRSHLSEAISIYFIGPLGLMAFVAVFYSVVALVAKKKKENVKSKARTPGTDEDQHDENAFLNFVRVATTSRHADDKDGLENFSLASSLMSLLKPTVKNEEKLSEREALLELDAAIKHHPNNASAALEQRQGSTSVAMDVISKEMSAKRMISAVQTREWAPQSSSAFARSMMSIVIDNDESLSEDKKVEFEVTSLPEKQEKLADNSKLTTSLVKKLETQTFKSLRDPVSEIERERQSHVVLAPKGAGVLDGEPKIFRSMTTKFY